MGFRAQLWLFQAIRDIHRSPPGEFAVNGTHDPRVPNPSVVFHESRPPPQNSPEHPAHQSVDKTIKRKQIGTESKHRTRTISEDKKTHCRSEWSWKQQSHYSERSRYGSWRDEIREWCWETSQFVRKLQQDHTYADRPKHNLLILIP